ncbi:MAG: YegS/Rv2252/BmrU family lipid kinase [Clostridia bacterium]|nr:YegS/Rv2252/BmrU family lipid kinase [Clostridia bacterium]
MKHVFIINPKAGKKDNFKYINSLLENYKSGYDIEVHQTNRELDATEFTKNYLSKYDGEVRFYACGGDGTLNEVVNGIVGYDNASVGLFPCGSGNDFVKSVGDIKMFNDLEKLLNAPNKEIDVIKVNDKYSINVVNFGFEAYVCKVANNLKKKRTQNSYTLGIVAALFMAMKNEITVEVEGEIINQSGTLLLGSFANGGYAGGKYNCAPRYQVDDGLMEVLVVKPTNVFNLISLIKVYEKGEHLNPEQTRIAKLISYCRGKKAKLYSKKEFDVCIDGEIISGKEFDVEILERKIKFAIPN